MHFFVKTMSVLALTAAGSAFAGNHDPAVIIPLMASSKLTLIQGIELSEAAHGPATSAKFEVGDDGKLVLSVYNIPEGFGVEPEAATLSEVSIDPTADSPVLNFEVFTDKAHIARAAAHMTLFRLSHLSLAAVIQRAADVSGATPIDVRNPTIANRRPVADVVLFNHEGKALTIRVDLLNGSTRRQK